MALLTRVFWACIIVLFAGFGFLWWYLSPPRDVPAPVVVHKEAVKPVTGPKIAPKPRRLRKRPAINCKWVPVQAYQWPEGTVLSYAQQNYSLTPTQLRVLKYCVEHHHGETQGRRS